MNYVRYMLFFNENTASVNFSVKNKYIAINMDRPIYQKANEA